MNLTIIGNVNELTAAEQKKLYTEGAEIYTGVFYVLTDVTNVNQNGKDVIPSTPTLRAISNACNITWIITEFRGKRVAFGSASP